MTHDECKECVMKQFPELEKRMEGNIPHFYYNNLSFCFITTDFIQFFDLSMCPGPSIGWHAGKCVDLKKLERRMINKRIRVFKNTYETYKKQIKKHQAERMLADAQGDFV